MGQSRRLTENESDWFIPPRSGFVQRVPTPRTGSSGGSPFERARKAVVESINEIANHIETIALRMKQFIFRAPAENDDVAKDSGMPSDHIDL